MLNFGKSVGTACASFAITNIDDMFVLVTFFSEASRSKSLTPLKIVLGQYIGFTVIVIISLIGFGASYLIPTEPIGFFGLLPILLGIWRFFDLLMPLEDDESENAKLSGIKNTLKVSVITVMNGGDNIGTYIPLFSQARRAEIAIYVVIYYILLGVWCLVAFMVMREKHVLSLVRRYMHIVIPFLYIGLGLYIIIKSLCYPWSIEKINHSVRTHPGKVIMSIVTVFSLSACITAMLFFRLRKRAASADPNISLEGIQSPATTHTIDDSHIPAHDTPLEGIQSPVITHTVEDSHIPAPDTPLEEIQSPATTHNVDGSRTPA